MSTVTELSAALHGLPMRERAALAVELIDSLGDDTWSADDLAALAEERDAELESGAVNTLSYEEFIAGLRRPADSP